MQIVTDVTKIIDNVILTAGGSTTSIGIDLSNAVFFGLGFASKAYIDGVRVDVFGDPNDNSIDFSIGANDIPYDSSFIPMGKGALYVKKGFFPVPIMAKYVKVKMVNLVGSVSVDSNSIWAFVQKQI